MSPNLRELQSRLASICLASSSHDLVREQGEKLKEMFSEYEEFAKQTYELLKRASREKPDPKAEDKEQVTRFSNTLKGSAFVLKAKLEEMASAQERLDSALTRIFAAMYAVVNTLKGFPAITDSVKGISAPKPETLKELNELCKKLGVTS